ncbi:MAG: glutamine synthetase, partial [Halomonas sp.]
MSPHPAAEARDFLARHPEIETIDLLISDLNGVLRGKRVARENLEKAYIQGINLPASVYALDILGNTIEATGLGLAS